MTRRALAAGIMAALACTLAGCAVRYDQAGVSRVGVFLWGFGDPPGVNWNLDAPRREIPELPAASRPDLPPREPARAPRGPDAFAPNQNTSDRFAASIDDNRPRVLRAPASIVPLAPRGDDRDDDAARR